MDDKHTGNKTLRDDEIRIQRGILRRSLLTRAGLAVAAATAAAFYGVKSAGAKDTDRRTVADPKGMGGRNDSDKVTFRDPK